MLVALTIRLPILLAPPTIGECFGWPDFGPVRLTAARSIHGLSYYVRENPEVRLRHSASATDVRVPVNAILMVPAELSATRKHECINNYANMCNIESSSSEHL